MSWQDVDMHLLFNTQCDFCGALGPTILCKILTITKEDNSWLIANTINYSINHELWPIIKVTFL